MATEGFVLVPVPRCQPPHCASHLEEFHKLVQGVGVYAILLATAHAPTAIIMKHFFLVICVSLFADVYIESEESDSLGSRIVAFCVKQKGRQVGNGECASLATIALKESGAKGMGTDSPHAGDFTWGDVQYYLEVSNGGLRHQGKLSDIKSGDVVQFRDAIFVTQGGNRASTRMFPHHTAIVQRVTDGGKSILILHQNYNGQRVVQEATLQLGNLTQGWLRVYRPVSN